MKSKILTLAMIAGLAGTVNAQPDYFNPEYHFKGVIEYECWGPVKEKVHFYEENEGMKNILKTEFAYSEHGYDNVKIAEFIDDNNDFKIDGFTMTGYFKKSDSKEWEYISKSEVTDKEELKDFQDNFEFYLEKILEAKSNEVKEK